MRWRWRNGKVGRVRSQEPLQAVLAACPAGSRVMVIGNAALQTVEMGLCSGSVVEVLRNESADHLLVIQAGDTRLTLPRDLAASVFVQDVAVCGPGQGAHRPHLLRAIRGYLGEHGTADTRALAIHFEVEEEAMEGMLAFLASRGLVKRQDLDCRSGCAGCQGCGWVPKGNQTQWSLVQEMR